MKQKLVLAMSMACLMASCTDDDVENKVIPTPGAEVQFASSLNSRTLPGVENEEGTGLGLKWVDGDLITVYGTTCVDGRKQAEYKVSATTAPTNTPHVNDGQNYADALTKTGEYGVQWGEEATSDFYAIYPSIDGNVTETTGGIKVTTTIRQQQNNVFSYDATNKIWKGTPYVDNMDAPNMTDAIMYAYTADAKNGETVNLRFKPFTTVLKFKLEGWDNSNFSGGEEEIQISNITLTAPEGVKIAGDFELALSKGEVSATAASDAVNTISIPVLAAGGNGAYVSLKYDTPLEFSVYTIPESGKTMTVNDPWKVTLTTAGYGTYEFPLKPQADTALEPGQIHKVQVKKIGIEQAVPLDPTQWIAQIPRNVYLSELSIPGAWYATDANYQATTDLNTQYEAGIRAFHIDCRVSTDKDGIGFTNHVTSENMVLACSGTESYSYEVFRGWNTTIGKTVKQAIDEIHTAFNNNAKEYVVVVLSIAEKPWTRKGGLDRYHYGVIDPATVLSYISSMISDNASTWNLYTNQITANTTVNDVLGHMIIKVNVNTTADKFTGSTYTVPNTLLSEASMCSDSEYYSGDIVYGTFSKMQSRNMYWGKTQSDLTYYYHQAQLTLNDQTNNTTSGTPSFKDRMDAVDNIISQSKTIYDNNLHNAWFQMGIGGYIIDSDDNEDRATVASVMNPYVQTKIEEKISTDPSPVGIVLMNFATTTGAGLVTDIISMNEKFYLNRDPEADPWPDTTTSSGNNQVATTKVGDAEVSSGGAAF